LGPVNDDPHLAELMTLVADKDLSEHGGLAQRAVWEVTDGEGLEEKTRAALRAL
jgi:hypothetical protein